MRADRYRVVRRPEGLRLEHWRGDEPADGRLFQEVLRAQPFWMLVACSLVNLTTWQQARPALEELVRRHAGPERLAELDPEELHDVLRPLGLWRRRAVSLVRLAKAWLREPPTRAINVLSMPGCGRYAADSWAIFVEGRTDVDPADGKLSWYLSQLKLNKESTQ